MNNLIASVKRWPPQKVMFYTGCVYAVGIIGFTLPATRELFHYLVPVNITLTALLAVAFHPAYTKRFWFFALFCFAAGYFVELAGTRTGIIFGRYTYGTVLGPKVAGVPPLIGANWFLLTYCCGVLVSHLRAPVPVRIIIATLLMTGYDLILEPNAVRLGFWAWENYIIPLRNFIAWFIVSLVMQTVFSFSLPGKTQNPVAVGLYFIQAVFFVILFFLYKIWG